MCPQDTPSSLCIIRHLLHVTLSLHFSSPTCPPPPVCHLTLPWQCLPLHVASPCITFTTPHHTSSSPTCPPVHHSVSLHVPLCLSPSMCPSVNSLFSLYIPLTMCPPPAACHPYSIVTPTPMSPLLFYILHLIIQYDLFIHSTYCIYCSNIHIFAKNFMWWQLVHNIHTYI